MQYSSAASAALPSDEHVWLADQIVPGHLFAAASLYRATGICTSSADCLNLDPSSAKRGKAQQLKIDVHLC